MDQVHTTIAIEQLHESPFNPRRTFHDADLQELAADIQALGIHTPILVRPRMPNVLRTAHDAEDGYEIVFGHRRYRAALLAGLQEVPAMVRTLTDEQAKRIQISENLAREDVHAIEEAEGMAALVREHGVTAEELIEQTGKSRSYVYGRLKLATVAPAVSDACLAGDFGAETALLLARIPGWHLQVKALGKIRSTLGSLGDGGRTSYRTIRDLLVDEFSLDLKEALWQLDDALLVPNAGACSTCPKRSGCAPELYGDVVDSDRQYYYGKKGADICMDPDCFKDKKTAHLALKAAELEGKGKTVIDGRKALAAVSAHGEVKGAFVALTKVRSAIKQAKGTTKPEVVVIQDPRTGKTFDAVRRTDLQAAGIQLEEKKPKGSPTRDWEAERRENDAKAAVETQVRREIFKRVRAATLAAERTSFDLRLLATYAIDTLPDDSERLVAETWGMPLDQLRLAVLTMSNDELTQVLLDAAIATDVDVAAWDLDARPEHLLMAAEHYGIDVDQVRAGVAGEVIHA